LYKPGAELLIPTEAGKVRERLQNGFLRRLLASADFFTTEIAVA